MHLTPEEEQLAHEADRYIKDHKDQLIERFANPAMYHPDSHPSSYFMAGSPGAGKTEFSVRLIERLPDNTPVRIDADEIRAMLPGYTGGNAHIFQRACSTGVSKLFEHVLHQKLNAMLDGTFAHQRAMENIQRSLSRGRQVVIYYIFQDPIVAWQFTQAREEKEGRRILKDTFINGMLSAYNNVKMAKREFGSAIVLNLVIKNFRNEFEDAHGDISDIDSYLPKVYTQEELEKLI
ncbi:MAG: zeta toxin family protein [Patescibacteria group bacterium]